MKSKTLVDFEISNVNWDQVRELCGPASSIPHALNKLITSGSPDECETAYWELENHVVVQGQLFDSAVHVVDVILAALSDSGTLPRHAKIGLLELLFQIVSGKTDEEKRKRGVDNIESQCQIHARSGMWLLYKLALDDRLDVVMEILHIIDDNKERLQSVNEILAT